MTVVPTATQLHLHSNGDASLLHPNAGAALGTPGLAALLLAQILPVFSVVAPCQPAGVPSAAAALGWSTGRLAVLGAMMELHHELSRVKADG